MKFFIQIYGCQYNEWDGSRLSYALSSLGLEESMEKEAEVVFVLACSVRQTGIDRLYGKARNWVRDGKRVFLSGCLLDQDKNKFVERGVVLCDLKSPEDLKNAISSLDLPNTPSLTRDLMSEGNAMSTYLPIMTGCNNFCAYCAVPYTRGREKSRPVEEIVQDFKKMLENGQKEILLLGQNVNSYKSGGQAGGSKEGNNNDFASLLTTLNNIPGEFVIRFSSNHPKDMSDEIIAAVRDLPKVKKEIHLPVQSGSNTILKAMNRPYTREQYLALVEKIKKEIPKIELMTDSIVGFPGETEAEFQETVDLYRQVGFAQSFNNKYSPRSGTAAYPLGDPVPWEEKQRRWRILNEIGNARFIKK